jgi:hypothetical protein
VVVGKGAGTESVGTGAVDVGSGAGAEVVQIGTGADGVVVGSGTGAEVVHVGTGAGVVDVGSGAGAELIHVGVGPGAAVEVAGEAVGAGVAGPFVVVNFELTRRADAAWRLAALTETSA